MINKGKGWAAFVRAKFFARKIVDQGKLIMDIDDVVARLRHNIDIITASFGGMSKTEIATLVLTAHLDGQCDAMENDDLTAASAEDRAYYVRSLRVVADKLQGS